MSEKTNIVDRLARYRDRYSHDRNETAIAPDGLLQDAIDEIERLEAEVDRLNEQVAYEQALNQVSN